MPHALVMIHAELDYMREEREELSRLELARFLAQVDSLADFADVAFPQFGDDELDHSLFIESDI